VLTLHSKYKCHIYTYIYNGTQMVPLYNNIYTYNNKSAFLFN